ncbi:MAG: hypothetical protein GWM98_03920 [Nitrospinaceae bacterium]|nr:hypothetical protein [Nitrospinaceae bacterium]
MRDLPWPFGEWRRECRYGILIGNHDPEVDFKVNGYIDYQTGLGVILFDNLIVNAANNIVADFEHEWVPTPLDLILAWDALMA